MVGKLEAHGDLFLGWHRTGSHLHKLLKLVYDGATGAGIWEGKLSRPVMNLIFSLGAGKLLSL
jgi:hypothetical protein